MSREARGRSGTSGTTGPFRGFLVLYSSWKTVLTNAVFFAVYYAAFYEVIVRSNSGFFLLAVPYYLFALLVLASSVLATVALRYVVLYRRKRMLEGLAQSPIGLAAGALVASCACALPLVAPVLYFLGLNSLEVSGLISFLAAYQGSIIATIVVLDALAVYYYLRLISRSVLALGRA